MAGPPLLKLLHHGDGGANLTGRAISTLESVTSDERFLHGMERVEGSDAFNRNDFISFVHDRKRETGIYAPAVDQHRAGAALTVIATFFGAGEAKMLTR